MTFNESDHHKQQQINADSRKDVQYSNDICNKTQQDHLNVIFKTFASDKVQKLNKRILYKNCGQIQKKYFI